MSDFQKILQAFNHPFPMNTNVRAIKIGIINDTFIVSEPSQKFILQKINHHVFLNIPELMSNIRLVLDHLQRFLVPTDQDRYPSLIATKNGEDFFLDQDENYWRLMTLVEETSSSYICESLSDAEEAARSLARFQKYLAPLKQSDFFITIENFHDIKSRLVTFKQAVETDAYGLLQKIKKDVDYLLGLEPWINNIVEILEQTPDRIVHNDLKFNNILFNDRRQAVCLVDYDTMMPGKIAYDFGELARTVACNLVEDDPHYLDVAVRKEYFVSLFKAYHQQTKELLEPNEVQSIAYAPSYMTLILAIRFLADYLNGSQYFKVDYAEHNRDRGLNQLYLFKQFHALESEFLREIINNK